MGWESVPWMVGGGAMHSAEIGRLLAYAATNGNEGVLGPDDLKVTAFSTPGAGVNISLGAAVIPCRSAGQLYQSYIGRMVSQDSAGVAGTGATVRYDMIVGRVEDPWLSGEPWADPVLGQEAVGPYIYTRLISATQAAIANWDAARTYLASLNMSAIPLAGISQPINNSSIAQNMITDLRRVANARRQRTVYTYTPASKSILNNSAFTNWGGAWTGISIPVWATRAIIVGTVSGIKLDRQDSSTNGTTTGQLRVSLGNTNGSTVVAYDEFSPKADSTRRMSLNWGDTITIQPGDRGTVKTLGLQANNTGGNQDLYIDSSSFSSVDIEFQEVAA